MQEFAELIRDAKNAVLVWSMGITQHAYGADAVQMVSESRVGEGLRRPGQMRTDADSRAFSVCRAARRWARIATAFPGGKPINADNAAAALETVRIPRFRTGRA